MTTKLDDRLLNAAEQEMVEQTRPPVLDQLSEAMLQSLLKRLRSARDRARRIARQQKREILGKGDPKGAAPARENRGTEEKADLLSDAVQLVSARLKQLRAPSQAELMRKAVAMKRAASLPQHPDGGVTARLGMKSKPSGRSTVKPDPREVGRVSQAVKVAQAKRDR